MTVIFCDIIEMYCEERLFVRLLELGWFEQDGEKATVYKVTALGEEKLTELGVEIYERRS